MMSGLLLDIHIVVRWLADPKRLSREQAKALERAVQRTEPVALSVITLLEIAVLVSEGKLVLKMSLETARLWRLPGFIGFNLSPPISTSLIRGSCRLLNDSNYRDAKFTQLRRLTYLPY